MKQVSTPHETVRASPGWASTEPVSILPDLCNDGLVTCSAVSAIPERQPVIPNNLCMFIVTTIPRISCDGKSPRRQNSLRREHKGVP